MSSMSRRIAAVAAMVVIGSSTAAVSAASAAPAAAWECGSSPGCLYDYGSGEGQRFAMNSACGLHVLPSSWQNRASSIRTYGRQIGLKYTLQHDYHTVPANTRQTLPTKVSNRVIAYRVHC
jgi:hypothetical protein